MAGCQLVVDTNVLVYASNKAYSKTKDCMSLIERLHNSNEFMCLDVGTSGHIFYEYKKHLPPGSEGYTLLLKLISENRLVFFEREIPSSINRKINMTGIKTSDRIFVRIAFKTDRKVLVTQEYEDFTTKNRLRFKSEINVNVIEACDFVKRY